MRVRRFSDEDGFNAGIRNIGRYALAMIPAALGGGVLVWAAAMMGWMDVRDRVRDAERVGGKPRATIQVVTHDDTCLHAEGPAVRNDDEIVLMVRNTCAVWMSPHPNYQYRVLSLDGTAIKSGRYAFDGDSSIAPDEKREQRIWVKDMDRVASVDVTFIDDRR